MNKVLDSLSRFEGNDVIDLAVFTALSRGMVLRNKGMSSLAEKYYEKAARQALLAERYDLAIVVFTNLLSLSIKDPHAAAVLKKRVHWRNRIRECMRIQKNIMVYTAAFDKLNRIESEVSNFKYGSEQHLIKVKAITNTEFLSDAGKAMCFESVCLFFLCKAKEAHAAGNQNAINANYRKLLQHMESHPEKIMYYKMKFRYALNQYLNSCLNTGEFADFNHYLERLEESGKALKGTARARHWLMIINLKLNRNFRENKIAENAEIVGQAEKELKANEKLLEPAFFAALYANTAITYFHQEQWKPALKYINKLLNNFPERGNLALLTMMRLLNLAVHYELRNEKLLNYLFKTYGALPADNSFTPLLVSVVKFISRLNKGSNAPAIKELKEQLNTFRKQKAINALLDDCCFENWVRKLK
jgi:tetratricopeptide (TPR) repeat protein